MFIDDDTRPRCVSVAAAAPRMRVRAGDFPVDRIGEPVAFAVLVGGTAGFYRPAGATMFVDRAGNRAGSLSSGCVDADVALHAAEVGRTGIARTVRYGDGSPFMDIRLPCGGGIDVLVLPASRPELSPVRAAIAARQSCTLQLGAMGISTQPAGVARVTIEIVPDPRFVVIGSGPEAATFASLAACLGYETALLSPGAGAAGVAVDKAVVAMPFGGPDSLAAVPVDADTAGVLFFHDHDAEAEILQCLVQTEAFYLGAQGSRRTAARRAERLRRLGIAEAAIARVRGPIGAVPAARDPRTLAASVLAEVLGEAQARL